METTFGTKLAELRRRKKLSLQDLGSSIGISKQSIHRYETNTKSPSNETIFSLSKKLGVHPSYFFQHGSIDEIQIKDVKFRQEENLTFLNTDTIEEIKRICKERLSELIELQALVGGQKEFENPLKGMAISSRKDVEKAAKKIRSSWKLGFAPIADITDTIESNGLAIIEIETIEDFNGLSGEANGEMPFIMVNTNSTELTRRRFTLLHELAHIVLEFAESLKNELVEKFCDHFAGAVLLVEDTILKELGKGRRTISLKELRALKEKYGASIHCIMVRARVTEVISKETYFSWRESYDEWRYSSEDNHQFGEFRGKEKSSKFNQLLIRGIKEQRISMSRAAEMKKTTVDALERDFMEPEFLIS